MVLMGAADYQGDQVKGRLSMVAFSITEDSFSRVFQVRMDPSISNENDWLWRVNWHRYTGYGVVYQNDQDASNAYLVKTTDGVHYQLITDLALEGKPNEATIKITHNSQMTMIIRREAGNQHGLLGRSMPPYTEWEWQDMGIRLGGPDFEVLPDHRVLLGSRVYGHQQHKTGLYINNVDGEFEQVAEFPSGGDTSYPGMVVKNDTLYISYYSGHQEKTAIYFASVALKQLKINN